MTDEKEPTFSESMDVPPGEKIIQLVERDQPKEPARQPQSDDPPGWAHELSDRMASLERRIPEPRAESGDSPQFPDDDSDEPQIVSIEEVTIEPVKAAAGAVKDKVQDAVEAVPEITHSLFRVWGGRK